MGSGAGKLRRLTEWLNIQCSAIAATGGRYPSAHMIAPFLEGSWEFSRILASKWCDPTNPIIEPAEVAAQTYYEIDRIMPRHATVLAARSIKYTTDLYKRTISNYYDLRRHKSEKIRVDGTDGLDFIDFASPAPDEALNAAEVLRTAVDRLTDDEIELVWVTVPEEFRQILQPFLEGRPNLDPQLSIAELAAMRGRSVKTMYRQAAAVRDKLIRARVG